MKNFFFELGGRFIQLMYNLVDPLVGDKILQLQRKSVLIRLDKWDLNKFRERDGIQPRVSRERLLSVRQSDVVNYQQFNENPFASGACNSILDLLDGFINTHKSHADGASIYVMYGKATSLPALKCELNIQEEGTDGRDSEKEQLIVEHIPFHQFIASISPKELNRFLKGHSVPNEMHLYNKALPTHVSMNALSSEQNLLTWLLAHYTMNLFSILFNELNPNVWTQHFHQTPRLLYEAQTTIRSTDLDIQIQNLLKPMKSHNLDRNEIFNILKSTKWKNFGIRELKKIFRPKKLHCYRINKIKRASKPTELKYQEMTDFKRLTQAMETKYQEMTDFKRLTKAMETKYHEINEVNEVTEVAKKN